MIDEEQVKNIVKKVLAEEHLAGFIKIFEKEHNIFRGTHEKISLPESFEMPQNIINQVLSAVKFIELTDTPESYQSKKFRILAVKYEEDGLEFAKNIIIPKTVFTDDFQSPDISPCHQGYTTDGTNHYCIHTNAIKKRDKNWNVIASNTDPFSGLSGYNHIGDGGYYNGKLYIPGENWGGSCASFSQMSIFVFNATTLARESVTNISAQGHEAAGITVVPDHGDNGIIYIASFCDGSKIWKYDLSDFSYLGYIALDSNVANIQGITYKKSNFTNGYFYVVSDYEWPGKGRLYAIDLDGHVIFIHKGETTGYHEGIDYSQDELRCLIDEAPKDGPPTKIHFLKPSESIEDGIKISEFGIISPIEIAARVFLSANYTGLPASTVEKINLDKVDFDKGAGWSITGFKFIAPEHRVYEITCHITWINIEDAKRYHCSIYKNNSSIADGGDGGFATVSTNCVTTIASGSFKLEKGEEVDIRAWSNASNGKRNIRGDVDGTRTYMSIVGYR